MEHGENMNIQKIIFASVVLVASACGGGGGGSNESTTTLAIIEPNPPAEQGLTIENYMEVLALAFINGFGLSNPVEDFFFGADFGPVDEEFEFECDSGSAVISLNFSTEGLAENDSVVLTSDDCVSTEFDNSQSRTSSILTYTVTDLTGAVTTGTPFTLTFLADTSAIIEEFAGPFAPQLITSDGTFEYVVNSDGITETTMITSQPDSRSTIAVDGARFEFGGAFNTRQVLDSSNQMFLLESSSSFALLTSRTNGDFEVQTDEAFTGIFDLDAVDNDDNILFMPDAGSISITDGLGGIATLTAISNSMAELAVDLDNDLIPETTAVMTYVELENLADNLF